MALCTLLPDMLCKFPAIGNSTMRVARQSIDDGFRDIVRSYGDVIDTVVHPLQLFLNSSERFFTQTPWIIIFLGLLAMVHLAGRSFRITLGGLRRTPVSAIAYREALAQSWPQALQLILERHVR